MPVRIREVGPRDGLQGERPVAVGERVALIEDLAATGLADIEAVAFVSPRVVPAMAGAAEVMTALRRRPGVRYWALVPNVRGAELALDASADGLSVTVSASDEYSRRNVGRSVQESVAELGCIASTAGGRVPLDAVISCAFGSPFEGYIESGVVAALARRLLDVGATSITLADTTGMATPHRIASIVASTGDAIGLHLHDPRGTAVVNAYAAIQLGISHFDSSVGGLGGSPFAPGAAGNLATEHLVALLEDLGVDSGVDFEAMVDLGRRVRTLVGHAVV